MKTTRCDNCQHMNQPGMAFCTNCGQTISFKESQIDTLAKLDVPSPARHSRNKRLGFWIGGLFGCLGVTVLAAAVFIAGIYAGGINNPKNPNGPSNSNDAGPLPNRSGNTPEEKNDRESAETHLLQILDDRREAGLFKQISATTVPAKDYFPRALGAVQAVYHNGSRYVSVSIGKYSDFELAKQDFDEQFSTVSKKGGQTQVLTPSADGTIHGVYQYNNNSYAEYCTRSAFCYRLASTDAKALKNFIENFIKP